ncbi:hypothetical protein [Flavobacterium filum]|uniref:hypothetical protein n=1 Tax=Flavobacterium filum TaxID=370974 RepID=UPI0023F2BD1E|nr:hypothetical protein [Flavobacterium filum]
MRNKIKNYLLSFTRFEQYYDLLLGYSNYLLDERDTFFNRKSLDEIKKILFAKNAIIVFPIRCNNRISFNDSDADGDGDIDWNNDLLVIVEYISENNFNVFTFDCTVDPKTNKHNIAHLIEQVYTGNVGNHRGILSRICIRSDRGTWFKRTDYKKQVVMEDFDLRGINIHDNNGLFNTSEGCPILQSQGDYKNTFKPLLNRVSNRNFIPVAVLNQDYFTDELKVK